MRLIRPIKLPSRRAAQSGFTLIEITMVMAILTVVMGVLFSISISIADTSRVQDIKVTTSGEDRTAMSSIMRELRGASRGSVVGPTTALGSQTITYRVLTDLDGNGLAVTGICRPELSDRFMIRRGAPATDGASHPSTQLVCVPLTKEGAVIPAGIRVLANGLPVYEDTDNDGVLDVSEDTNRNGQLDRGIWFAFERRTEDANGNGILDGAEDVNGNGIMDVTISRRIQITVESSGLTRQGRVLVSRLTQSVLPRNS